MDNKIRRRLDLEDSIDGNSYLGLAIRLFDLKYYGDH